MIIRALLDADLKHECQKKYQHFATLLLFAFFFFRIELQTKIVKKKTRKFRNVTNMIADYYDFREQQFM